MSEDIEKLKARISELEALLSQTNEGYAECIATREDYRARIVELEKVLDNVKSIASDENVPTSFIRVCRIRAALNEKG